MSSVKHFGSYRIEEQKSMKQNWNTIFILASFILVALIMWQIISYMSNAGPVSPTTAGVDQALPTEIPATIDFVYCSTPASLCVVSFGQDNSGNMLIVIRNNVPGLAEFYAKLNPTETSEFYPCQKVQFASDLYYCLGRQIPDNTMVTMNVYSKNDDQLVASGSLLVSLEPTPAPRMTIEPAGTMPASAMQTSTVSSSSRP
jgi:hypothetical protein